MTAIIALAGVSRIHPRSLLSRYAFGAGQQTDAYRSRAFTPPTGSTTSSSRRHGPESHSSPSIRGSWRKKRGEVAQKTSPSYHRDDHRAHRRHHRREIFTPQFAAGCSTLTRPSGCNLAYISRAFLLPAQIFLYVAAEVFGGVCSATLFLCPGRLPIHLPGVNRASAAGRWASRRSPFGALAGSIAGPFLINAIGAAKIARIPAFIRSQTIRPFREWYASPFR